MNMSYCRFENTVKALRDCKENLDDSDLSKSEQEYRKQLLIICHTIAEDYEEE